MCRIPAALGSSGLGLGLRFYYCYYYFLLLWVLCKFLLSFTNGFTSDASLSVRCFSLSLSQMGSRLMGLMLFFLYLTNGFTSRVCVS